MRNKLFLVSVVFCLIAWCYCGIRASQEIQAAERSGQWRSLQQRYLANHPRCERCDRIFSDNCKASVHHKKSVDWWPELELVESNLIALCPSCHGNEAHFDRHYAACNPLFEEEVKLHKAMVKARPKTKEECAAFVKRFEKCFQESNYQNAP